MSGLGHIFLPWSVNPILPYPPVGTEALCGHALESRPSGVINREHPDACPRCRWLYDQGVEEELQAMLEETVL